jgi:hypothetical protein
MTENTPKTKSASKGIYSAVQLIVDPANDKLSHIRLINIIGAVTGSVLMFVLTALKMMTEGYFGIYMVAVGLTAVGYRAATRNDSSNPSRSPSGSKE